MDTIISIIIYIILFLTTLSSYPLMRKKKKKTGSISELPPGSMGWPYIGDTLRLYSQDPNIFFAKKQNRF